MKKEGIAPNEHTYNSLISCLGDSRRWEDATALFTEMKAEHSRNVEVSKK
jgi:pentatricopeptide repeat protein